MLIDSVLQPNTTDTYIYYHYYGVGFRINVGVLHGNINATVYRSDGVAIAERNLSERSNMFDV